MWTREKITHIITDLTACYNRQLPNHKSLVLKLVGVDKNMSVLIAKVLPIFQHYIYTGFGISKGSYGSEKEYLGGIGQGNLASGKSCKIKLYRIIRKIEKKEIEIKIYQPFTMKLMYRSAIVFVNDTSFYTNREKSREKIIKIIETYTSLYKATGDQIEFNNYYSW